PAASPARKTPITLAQTMIELPYCGARNRLASISSDIRIAPETKTKMRMTAVTRTSVRREREGHRGIGAQGDRWRPRCALPPGPSAPRPLGFVFGIGRRREAIHAHLVDELRRLIARIEGVAPAALGLLRGVFALVVHAHRRCKTRSRSVLKPSCAKSVWTRST